MADRTPEQDLRKIADPVERARRVAAMLEDPERDHTVLRRIQREAVTEALDRKGWTVAKIADDLGVTEEELTRLAADLDKSN